MISSIPELTLSEYLLSGDGAGAIEVWLRSLNLDNRAKGLIDDRFLEYRRLRFWELQQLKGAFQPLVGFEDIPFKIGRFKYRILGSFITRDEFVMLVGFKERRDGTIPEKIRAIAEERSKDLSINPGNRREYRFD
jgi:hypothetical protein